MAHRATGHRISLDDDPALVRSLVGKLKLNYPVAMEM